MSSKTEPSQFDAYSKAESDEPSFTLLGRDPIAPSLIEAWAYLRSGQIGAAEIAFKPRTPLLTFNPKCQAKRKFARPLKSPMSAALGRAVRWYRGADRP
jgi:hypothetical protein